MSSYRDGVEHIGAIGENIARGILPTAEGWDIDPTNLKNITDEHPLTATGIGSKTTGGPGTAGSIIIDLGQSTFIIVMVRAAVWTTAGNTFSYLELYDDLRGVYLSPNSAMNTSSAYENICGWLPMAGYTSKLKMRLYSSAAATVECKIYEIIALEIFP